MIEEPHLIFFFSNVQNEFPYFLTNFLNQIFTIISYFEGGQELDLLLMALKDVKNCGL